MLFSTQIWVWVGGGGLKKRSVKFEKSVEEFLIKYVEDKSKFRLYAYVAHDSIDNIVFKILKSNTINAIDDKSTQILI